MQDLKTGKSNPFHDLALKLLLLVLAGSMTACSAQSPAVSEPAVPASAEIYETALSDHETKESFRRRQIIVRSHQQYRQPLHLGEDRHRNRVLTVPALCTMPTKGFSSVYPEPPGINFKPAFAWTAGRCCRVIWFFSGFPEKQARFMLGFIWGVINLSMHRVKAGRSAWHP